MLNFNHLIKLCLSSVLFISCSCTKHTQTVEKAQRVEISENSYSQQLELLSQQWWDFNLEKSPEMATSYGEHQYDALLSKTDPASTHTFFMSLRAFEEKVMKLEQSFKSVSAINEETLQRALLKRLNVEEQVTLQILQQDIKESIHQIELGFNTFDVSQMGGPASTFPYFMTVEHPFSTKTDIENLLKRYLAFDKYIDGKIENLKIGLVNDQTAPKINVERVIKQLKNLVSASGDNNVFYQVKDKLPGTLTATERQNFEKRLKLNAEKVRLSFAKYLTFIENEYLSKSRVIPGVSSMTGGKEIYSFLSKMQTTTALTPDEIHQIGLNELKNIEKELSILAKKKGFEGSGWEFTRHLMKDRSQFAKSREEYFKSFQVALKRADQKLPEYFHTLPKLAYEVKPMDSEREKDAPAAYYEPGSEKAGRPGIFVANLYHFEERPLFNAAVLAYHESVPGHHLQIAVAQELGNIPTFRKEGRITAFVEGWGLYSEQLSKEMGLYASIEEEVGYLGFAAWRASRLVVDTGLHAKGWSRKKAIDFLAEHTTLGQIDVENEIDRYIVWPGQALGYMIGKLHILKLRARAKKNLSQCANIQFSIKDFHEIILSSGPIPLSVLEQKVDQWIQKELDNCTVPLNIECEG